MYLTDVCISPRGKAMSVAKTESDSWGQFCAKFNKWVNPPEYYQNLTLQPGFAFIAELARREVPFDLPFLKVPPTILTHDSKIYVVLSNVKGPLSVTQGKIKYQEFYRITSELKAKEIQKVQERISERARVKSEMGLQPEAGFINDVASFLACDDRPDVVVREKEKENSLLKYVLNLKNINQLSQGMVLHQRYVIPSDCRANLFRLFYRSRNCRSSQQTHALHLTNWQKVYFFDSKKKQFRSQNLWVTASEQDSFQVVWVRGQALRPYQLIAEDVIRHIERFHSYRVLNLVLDFVIDFWKVPYLVNVKSIAVESALPVIRRMDPADLAFLSCTEVCKLCGLQFRAKEASKIITYKLIFQLMQHLRKRGIELSVQKFNLKSTRPCKVCELCYELVVEEHSLIDVEQRLARVQRCPAIDELRRVPSPCAGPPRMLYQWRLLLFLNEIKDLDKSPEQDLQLLFQFAGCRTNFKLGKPTPGQPLPVLAMKVHYFFSDRADVSAILAEQLRCRLVRDRWDDFVGEGVSTTLKNFKSKFQCQRHYCNMLFFFGSSEYASLDCYVGLVCDGEAHAELVQLQEFAPGIFFPEPGYYNCNPFPEEWMEVMVPGYRSKIQQV